MGKKILIADDEKDIVKLVATRLEKENYETLTAFDGQEAYDTIIREEPDLIIIDILMPVMTGCQVIGSVRAHVGNVQKTPIIILTAKPATRYLIKDEDVQGFHTKPFKADELLENIRTLLA